MGKRIIIFGASGMVGRGILLECLDSNHVDSIVMVNRKSIGVQHEKLKEVIHSDFLDYSVIEDEMKNLDACFWPLGISAVGLCENKYTKITYDYTMAAAKKLKEFNPDLVFCYVSGVGTDSTEGGRQMWARVKGRTENDLIKLFRKAYMFRPGYIQPKRGVKSKTGWYNAMYVFFSWLYPLFKLISPNSLTTTIDVGKAMIYCAVNKPDLQILTPKDINEFSKMS